MENSTIIRAMTRDGSARITFINSTAAVRRMGEIHQPSKTMTAVLGRVMSAASLMGSLLKDKEDTLTLRFDGDGPAGKIIAVSDYMGNVRICADNYGAELLPNAQGKLDVGGAVGQGNMYVIRDLGLAEPYIGSADIVTGEIAEDITNYFAVSEQTPTVCALGVRVDRDKECFAAGGYLVQLLPGAEEEVISALERNIASLESVSKMIADGISGEEIIARVFDGIEFDLFDDFECGYKCNCSRERYLSALQGLCREDIDDLMRLCEADITSKNREKKKHFLQNFQLVREKLADLEARDNYRTWHNPITGEEIMETFGLQPCREVGILKQAVKDAIWNSVIPNDHDAAFQFMLEKAKEMGLSPTASK